MTIIVGQTAAAAAAASGSVSILDQTFHHGPPSFPSSAMRTAGNVFQSDGRRFWRRTFTGITVQLNALTDWIIPNGAASSLFEIRLTNLNWIEKDEGFGISPSGGVWIDEVTTPTGGDPDGDEDIWFDLGTTREWTFVDNDQDTDLGTQHAQFDFQIRLGSNIIASAAMDWFVNSNDPGEGAGGGCFEAGTCFRMADGSIKKIEDITIHDEMELGGKVTHVIVGDGMRENWFDVDGIHVTGSHIMKKGDEWMHVRNGGFEQIVTRPIFYILINDEHRMVAENGQVFADFMDEAYNTYGDGWDDFIIDILNGKLKMKFVDYEKQKCL